MVRASRGPPSGSTSLRSAPGAACQRRKGLRPGVTFCHKCRRCSRTALSSRPTLNKAASFSRPYPSWCCGNSHVYKPQQCLLHNASLGTLASLTGERPYSLMLEDMTALSSGTATRRRELSEDGPGPRTDVTLPDINPNIRLHVNAGRPSNQRRSASNTSPSSTFAVDHAFGSQGDSPPRAASMPAFTGQFGERIQADIVWVRDMSGQNFQHKLSCSDTLRMTAGPLRRPPRHGRGR